MKLEASALLITFICVVEQTKGIWMWLNRVTIIKVPKGANKAPQRFGLGMGGVCIKPRYNWENRPDEWDTTGFHNSNFIGCKSALNSENCCCA